MTTNTQLSVEQINARLKIQNDIRNLVQEKNLLPGTKFSTATFALLATYRKQEEEIMNNPASPLTAKEFAIASLKQIEAAEAVFAYTRQYGFAPGDETAEHIVKELSQKPLSVWVKARPFGNASDAMKDASTKAVDSTLSAINRFANFVAQKTQR